PAVTVLALDARRHGPGAGCLLPPPRRWTPAATFPALDARRHRPGAGRPPPPSRRWTPAVTVLALDARRHRPGAGRPPPPPRRLMPAATFPAASMAAYRVVSPSTPRLNSLHPVHAIRPYGMYLPHAGGTVTRTYVEVKTHIPSALPQ
ncbi:hypothetical protein Vretifemale_20998, partial [Volvox reticuliferus]